MHILSKLLSGSVLASAALLAASPAAAAVTVNDRLSVFGTRNIFFSFTGGSLSVAVNENDPNGLQDPELFIFRDNGSSPILTGTRIANDDDSGPGLNSLFLGNVAAGNYVLAVGTYNFSELEARLGVADYVPGERRFTAVFGDGVTVPAVPEPATWAMMLVGFGMTGAAMRYRRRETKVAYA
ncbi:MAG TPA: DVUA0089 family protein [Sphingomonas sp.]|nr:DVUA0089 family protein [Sphingomonas sp.]